jgi:hypothetical protein
MDSRKNRSSSTIETNDAFGIRPRSAHVPAIRVLQQCRRARTVRCAEERPQAMLGPVNIGLDWMRIPSAGCQGAAEANVGARNFGLGRARDAAENEAVISTDGD